MKGFRLGAVIVLAGCGGAAGGNFEQEFAAACGASSNLPPAVCECMAKKAREGLNEEERSFVLAALQKDSATTDRLRTRLGLEGMMRAGTFMTRVSECAGALPNGADGR
jgi:hypothetical protein